MALTLGSHLYREIRVDGQTRCNDLNFIGFISCVDYIRGKLPTRDKKKRVNRFESILNLINTNIFGPITLVTMGGYKCYIMFINDYFRYGWIDFFHEKLESPNAFKTFKEIVKLKTSKVTKFVRLDKGGEYYGSY